MVKDVEVEELALPMSFGLGNRGSVRVVSEKV